jgi:hypothetical protein
MSVSLTLLGLRLSVSGGREAIARLAAVVIAVGVGTGMLLATLAMMNAVGAWNNRHAWFWTGSERLPATAPAPGVAPLWWQTGRDLYDGQHISRFDLAATGPTSPVPPGLPRDPGPGQYYASPALAALIKSPASQLAGRYPGRLAGIIGNAGLPSPGSLVIVIGYDPAQLAGQPGTTRVTSIATRLPPSSGSVSGSQPNPKGLQATPADVEVNQLGTDFILSVIALAILAPVLIWVSTATRLSAARREQRFAALRLTGATRRQVSVLAGVEATVAAVIGAAIGFGLFFPLRVPLTGLRITGEGFFLGDFSLSPSDILLVAIGVPVASALAARLALRRVNVSPLGVIRRVTPRPPRAWRVIPLLAGVADLGFFVVHGEPASTGGQVLAILPGFLLIITGLIIAGPWLTMAGARVLARRTSRPATMLAARRLGDDPHTAFRAVSGLVLALFIATVAVASVNTEAAAQQMQQVQQAGIPGTAYVLTQVEGGPINQGPDSPATVTTPVALPATLPARLSRVGGVSGVLEVRAYPGLTVQTPDPRGGTSAAPAGLVSCAQLATMPVFGRCPAGAAAALFPQSVFDETPWNTSLSKTTWPAATIPSARQNGLRVDSVYVATNGSVAALEQARTLLEAAAPPSTDIAGPPASAAEQGTAGQTLSVAFTQFADLIILISLVIASCTLLTGVIGGLIDRRRPFSVLRLTGARLATLRRVVLLEGAVPLLTVAAVAIGVGFAASAMYASAVIKHSLIGPGAEYYAVTAAGIILSLAIIGAAFPLLARITGPEVARNE